MNWQFLFATFDARIGRQTFWIGTIVLWVVSLIVHGLIAVLFGYDTQAGTGLSGVVVLVMLYPSIAVGVKRLHDRDKSGWWLLLLIVPVIGIIWYIVEAGCLRGTVGQNRFGPDPLAA